jgi:GH24 family phage-related lysozyme (muramidase)
MITQELKTKYEISDEGEALSQLILSYIVDEVSTYLPPDQSIVNYTDASKETVSDELLATGGSIPQSPVMQGLYTCFDKQLGRGDNYKINKCIETGIVDYMKGYSIIDLKSVGVSTPIPPYDTTPVMTPASTPTGGLLLPNITVDDAYNLKHVGQVDINRNSTFVNMFTSFSIGRLFGVDVSETTETDTTAVIGDFFNDIVSWLNFNLQPPNSKIPSEGNSIKIHSSGFERETWMNGSGVIYFIGDVNTYLDGIKKNLVKLNEENYKVYTTTYVQMDNYFELVWAIISTGLTGYLNVNEVYTDDGGGSIYTVNTAVNPAPPVLVPYVYEYKGNSKGVAVFTKSLQQKVVITAIDIDPPGIKIDLSKNLDLSDIDTNIRIETKDASGNTKVFTFPLILSKIEMAFNDISKGLAVFIDNITLVVTKLFNTIENVFIRIGETFETIAEYLGKAYEQVYKIIGKIVEKINLFFEVVLKKITNFFTCYIVRPIRDWTWGLLTTNPDPNISGPANIYYKARETYLNIRAKINSITVIVVDRIQKILTPLLKTVELIQQTLVDKVVQITRVFAKLKVKYGDKLCYKIDIPNIPDANVTLPEVPASPPEVPDAEGVFPKTTSDDIEFDEKGDLINESPVVTTATNKAVDASVAATPVPEVKVPDTAIPKAPTAEDIAKSNPPKTSPQVTVVAGYNDVSKYKTSLTLRNRIKMEEIGMTTAKGKYLGHYPDPDKVSVDIGYGHRLGKWVNRANITPKQITLAQAEAYLDSDLLRFETQVKKTFKNIKMTQGQFDSFIDLVYTTGSLGYVNKSTKKFTYYQTVTQFRAGNIKQSGGDYKQAAITAGGAKLQGLVNRRKYMYDNFFTKNWGIK